MMENLFYDGKDYQMEAYKIGASDISWLMRRTLYTTSRMVDTRKVWLDVTLILFGNNDLRLIPSNELADYRHADIIYTYRYVLSNWTCSKHCISQRDIDKALKKVNKWIDNYRVVYNGHAYFIPRSVGTAKDAMYELFLRKIKGV